MTSIKGKELEKKTVFFKQECKLYKNLSRIMDSQSEDIMLDEKRVS